jgi:hypothetical protein
VFKGKVREELKEGYLKGRVEVDVEGGRREGEGGSLGEGE